MMVSMPYSGSTQDYLKGKPTFDVRKSPSYMGMVSESFRKRDGVLRSLNPAHPVLAFGPKAEWIVADHDKCIYSCGPGSPFEKLLQLDGKIVVYHVRFPTISYVHYAEHVVEKMLPFPLYDSETFEVPTIDAQGELRVVKTRPFSPEAVRRRRPHEAVDQLRKKGLIKSKRVGNSGVLVITARESLECYVGETRAGKPSFDVT
jgi:aminoglycoside 3-N-acetyltransferase